jgi:predicted aldo/keto reductase-like oxidoreductase
MISRRKFINISGLAAGSALALGASRPVSSKKNFAKEDKKILSRTLGKTGLVLPVVSLGVMNTYNPGLVTAALEGGMVHLDSAQVYQGGNNEKMLGKVLKGRKRDSFVISTKVIAYDKKYTVQSFIEKFEESLVRLQMDYVDILYLHDATNREYPLNETILQALQTIKKQGKARFLGVTSHNNMPEVLNAAVDSKVYEIVLSAYNFTMKDYKKLNEAIDRAALAGLGIVGMKTMAGVYWDKERTKAINTVAALKWSLQNNNVHTTVPGCTAYDQLEANLEVLKDFTLSEQEKMDLIPPVSTTGLFCRGCNECVAACPKGLPIPDLMRSYMYVYGYRDLALGRNLIDKLNMEGNPCSGCSECKVKCSSGFNIAMKIADIHRLKDIPAEFIG